MKIKFKDVIVCGFALFAIFFGAGNLIFPPYLGVITGDRWFTAMVAFLLSDPLIPITGVIVTAFLGGSANKLGERVHPLFPKILATVSILVIGPFFSVPRTGATTHEIFIKPIFPSVPLYITCLVFFALTFYLTLKPGKVIDIVGEYLTPALLILLTIIVGTSIINPPGDLIATDTPDIFARSFKEGYQTMDALGAALMTGIVVSDLKRRGYKEEKTILRACVYVGLIALILLALVYGSLTYAGSTVSSFYNENTDRTMILVGLVEKLLGNWGKWGIGLAVALACLTTSVGLTSTCANYFESTSGGKLSYKTLVTVSVIIEFFLSLLGVNGLINFAVPVLSAIYPMVIALIFMSLFDKWNKHDASYRGAMVGAFIIGIIQSIYLASQKTLLVGPAEWTFRLPLANIGFEWFLPTFALSLAFTIFGIIFTNSKSSLRKKI